jgi:hypothetical protein
MVPLLAGIADYGRRAPRSSAFVLAGFFAHAGLHCGFRVEHHSVALALVIVLLVHLGGDCRRTDLGSLSASRRPAEEGGESGGRVLGVASSGASVVGRRCGRSRGEDLWCSVGGWLTIGGVLGARFELFGRDAQLAVVAEFVAASDRWPAAVVVRGEPGIGSERGRRAVGS